MTDWGPYFENAEGQGINGSQNVALHLGATALLDCRVAMLSGKKVFVRKFPYRRNRAGTITNLYDFRRNAYRLLITACETSILKHR